MHQHYREGGPVPLWIFRDGKKTVPTRKMIGELESSLRSASAADREALLDALIRAGELEAALADCDSQGSHSAAALTDALARAFLGEAQTIRSAHELLARLAQQSVPTEITISPPEGFAYYALSPLDFSAGLRLSLAPEDSWAVIGIRSIGTTLSALASASLEQRGAHTQRITVRPTGHPFDRVTHFTPQQERWIASLQRHGPRFLVVDEGPGMSGSSFLSVAEALERTGVPADRIYLAGSRDPDLETLRAPDAARRWRRYHWQSVTSQVHAKYRNHEFFGADQWRARHFREEDWPSCWTQMERLKFLSSNGDTLFKFEGFGRFGREVRERSQRIADAGFGYPVENAGDGMSAYSYVDGRLLGAADLTSKILDRIAEYCAHRREFLASGPVCQQLPKMVAFNLEQEFGAAPPFDLEALICERPVVTDGQMYPHEWMRTRDGRILKFDGSSHGDDHFFPGPTGIAWDLAGAIVEWKMNQDAADRLAEKYKALTGDDPSRRLPIYLLAYSVFRMGYCKMAAEVETGTPEAARLKKSYRLYRQAVERQLTCGAIRQSRAA